MAYRRNGQQVEAVEPDLGNMPVTSYVSFVADRLACFIEELSAHCLQEKLPAGICLTEIPLAERPVDLPERFHITPRKGGRPKWSLAFHHVRFEEI